ncbi:MAG: TatD family hydrolase [Bdellovibrionales bacterium]|nr:TatD family hydrolase [Bdellovibrionales bacterium]
MWIDAHSHINFMPFDQATQTVSVSKNISGWILGGYNPEEWKSQQKLKKKFPRQIWTSAGIHPWVMGRLTSEEWYEALKQLQLLVGEADFIGETGLDKNFDTPESRQEISFKKHIELALSSKKLLILHIVGQHGLALKILKEESSLVQRSVNGLIHGFSGSWEVAQEYINLGFYISIGPGILKENFKKLRETVAKIPLEFLVIESDSPGDFSKTEYLGEKVIPEIAEYVAELQQLNLENVKMQVAKNMKNLLPQWSEDKNG